MNRPTGEHQERETHPWAIDLLDHPARTESPAFRHAKTTYQKIMATLTDLEPYGKGPWQAHHGGSLWVFDKTRWRLYRNLLGIEWSLQFLSLPEKVEALRLNAETLVAAFPATEQALARLGDVESILILHTPVVDAETISAFTDSLWNSCLPLAAAVHVGILSTKNLTGGGAHHYPDAIWAGQFLKDPTFVYWVIDAEGQPAAVAPIAPRGSGVASVKVEYASAGTVLNKLHLTAHEAGKMLVLPPTSDLAVQAFAKQGGPVEESP